MCHRTGRQIRVTVVRSCETAGYRLMRPRPIMILVCHSHIGPTMLGRYWTPCRDFNHPQHTDVVEIATAVPCAPRGIHMQTSSLQLTHCLGNGVNLDCAPWGAQSKFGTSPRTPSRASFPRPRTAHTSIYHHQFINSWCSQMGHCGNALKMYYVAGMRS